MKEKITLISTIILAILLLASLYYSFFIKPKEITYTSFIPTTFSTTKSITETSTSYITKTEKETKTTTYSTTKTETLTTTYRIIENEAIIDVQKYISGYRELIVGYGSSQQYKQPYMILGFIVINRGNHSILFDADFIVVKGELIPEEWGVFGKSLFVNLGNTHLHYWLSHKKFILTPSNRSALFNIEILIDRFKVVEEYGKEKQGEIFITYRIIETNQFITFNSTFTYRIWKESD